MRNNKMQVVVSDGAWDTFKQYQPGVPGWAVVQAGLRALEQLPADQRAALLLEQCRVDRAERFAAASGAMAIDGGASYQQAAEVADRAKATALREVL